MSPLGKNILVLGATGQTGNVFIQQALRNPNTRLNLLVRNASKLPPECNNHSRVRTTIGSIGDPSSISTAMDGTNTVVILLGAYVSLRSFILRDTSTPIANSLPTVIEEMKRRGVKRILALSTAAFTQPEDRFSWGQWVASSIPSVIVPQGNAEMKAIGQAMSADDELEWTAFRVPHLNDGEEERKVWAGMLGPDFKGGMELSRPSLAKWVLTEIEERKWIRKAPMLGNY